MLSGVATTVVPVVTSSPAAGAQVNEVAVPEATIVTLPDPLQIPAAKGEGVTTTVGVGITVTVE